MSGEVQSAVIGALVGGLAGYVAASFQAWQDRRRRRRALASVLLLELRGVEYLLRRMVAEPDNLTGDFHAHHFDALDATVYELKDDAARLALSFRYRLDEIRKLRTRQAEKLSNQRRHRLLVKLHAAATEVPRLKQALLRSGGLEPPPEEYREVKEGEQLSLPPRAFDYGPPE